jgi:hypothetical protein
MIVDGSAITLDLNMFKRIKKEEPVEKRLPVGLLEYPVILSGF